MYIISKFKDYYDYLVGIYGIDEKLVLDRTEFTITPTFYPGTDELVKIFICGYQVDALYKDGKFYYTDDIEQFETKKKTGRWFWRNTNHEDSYTLYLNGSRHATPALKKPYKLNVENDVNTIFNCPILISRGLYLSETTGLKHQGLSFTKFPILKDYNFSSIFTPEEVWQMIYDFLSRSVDIPNTQTDKEKIISKGFDIKHSFRNTK